ncbi:MAG: tetratricopeptide repeat protein [Spirochaetales bacterium]
MKAVTSRADIGLWVRLVAAFVLAVSLGMPAGADDHRSIRATTDGDRIRVEIERAENDQTLVLFRGIEPLGSPDDLDLALEIARLDGGESEFTDTAPAGLPWYYGVFTEEALEKDDPQFIAGETVTDAPARVELEDQATAVDTLVEERQQSPRARPLPRLNPDFSPITGAPLPPSALPSIGRESLDPETEEAIDRLLEGEESGQRNRPEATILDEPEDRQDSENGRTLQQIVEATIGRERWDDAVDYLTSFLSHTRSPEMERRVYFYLGQAYYFRSEHRKAVLYLLQATDQYYAESRPFINAALNALAVD